jgi:hypothetical protein
MYDTGPAPRCTLTARRPVSDGFGVSKLARLGPALAIAVLGATALGAVTPPWPRTETRDPCSRYEPLRMPFFGDLHVHTRFSADAYIYGTRAEPHDAYAFAKGAPIAVSDTDEQPTRTARLDRPLDFAAVTDHSEFFGESLLCATPGSVPYDFDICQIFRSVETPQTQFLTIVQWLFPAGIDNPPPSLPFCTRPGVDCDGAAVSVWHTIQAAAEEAYDRTAGCTFTSFVGYEHTASPLGRHLHRNIIFRNAEVPPFAYSQLETAAEGVPQGIWNAIERNCLNAGTGCDAVIIPHNSNLSEGRQWEDPSGPEEALRRQLLEPLAEIHQVKGNSECRFDRLARMGIGTDDELCDFEQLAVAHEGPDNQPPPAIAAYPRRSMIRNTLKDGLGFEQRWGVNPWKLGFVGDTDTHDAAPGNTGEESWTGAHGANDASPERLISDEVHDNPGGLTGVWAEENSRDAIFEALRRRETYATSGTRPVVRFFAGDLDGVRCGHPDLVERAYTTGTAMGGDIGASGGRRGPRFVVWAAKDPGTADRPGTDLQRIQIVKGWVDTAGTTHESVFDVAGNATNGADVDHDTCAPTGSGARELCTAWRDPHFDPQVPAFYYARVLENPTCRWSTRVCKAAGVDPFSTDCAGQAAAVSPDFASCCLGPGSDAFIAPTVQERAWSSPVWYRPEGIARVRGRLTFGTRATSDTLSLRMWIGRASALDPLTRDLSVRIADAGTIFAVTIPAGTLTRRGRKLLAFTDRDGTLPGVRRVSYALRANGPGLLRIDSRQLDLSRVDPQDHMVGVSVMSGTYRADHVRRWTRHGHALAGA